MTLSHPKINANRETNMTTFGGSGQEAVSPGQNSEQLLNNYKNTFENQQTKDSGLQQSTNL